ncbi:cytosolic phospholipase A2 zeta [Echria macrotheca]|uniref:Lysophospholipase n=1 Tax=Echria macrotheca TaxID=438768 RepID=A0AAJ0BNY0_9PEZI|nr:cytosolic phospholipase A2 zeta [Echria macrotheca]
MRDPRQSHGCLAALMRSSTRISKVGHHAITASPQRAIANIAPPRRTKAANPILSAGKVPGLRQPTRSGYFWSRQEKESSSKSPAARSLSVIALSALLIYSLYPTDASLQRPAAAHAQPRPESDDGDQSAWSKFTGSFEGVPFASQPDLDSISDKVLGLLPEWAKSIPVYVRKLQRELNMGPGTLADEIWREAHDPAIHPEIQYEAEVRVSESLCDEEKTFLSRRRKVVAAALARYLGLDPEEVHSDDVPVIAMCGSGGGLRALVAGAGSLQATTEDGLFDCTTYISGVSGSCWLQTLFFSSIAGRRVDRVIEHLKARIGIHIAYPPAAFSLLTSAPTNKYILSGIIEKLKGDPGADFGLVDAYGMLLAARLLVPKGELGVNESDFKLSSQREHIRYGQNPLPIYTAVRHEIPQLDASGASAEGSVSEEAKEVAKKEAWFQWFEMTPYEFFCEEFGAGIPTWAMGRMFQNGRDKPADDGLRMPEVRMPSLLGIWGSAFCATLSHYYREIRPIIQSISGLQAIDDLIWGHNEDLSKVHPIDPATLPNFVYGMKGKLPPTVPEAIYDSEYLQLMDAGMSNNLPIYPLLRPGRDVDIVVAFDASADIKTVNWLSVVEGYARQRGIKGWPVGAGWPKPTESPSTVAKQLDQAQANTATGAEDKLAEAQVEQEVSRQKATDANPPDQNAPDLPAEDNSEKSEVQKAAEAAQELGYCTVWVGRTQERSSEPPPPPIDDASSWRLMEPDAGIAVVYLPYIANNKVPGVDPATSEYMSTWNFVYTPEQIDNAVALAHANYSEGKAQIRATVQAVYERKKKRRLEGEREAKRERLRRRMRLGLVHKLGEGDHFS